MLKKEFLDKVAENAGLYKYQAYMFWKAFEEVLIEELRQGEKIKIVKHRTIKSLITFNMFNCYVFSVPIVI